MTVLKPGLLTKSVQIQVPTCLKNIRQSCTLFLNEAGCQVQSEERKIVCWHLQAKQKQQNLWVISINLVSYGKTTVMLGGASWKFELLSKGSNAVNNCPIHCPFSYSWFGVLATKSIPTAKRPPLVLITWKLHPDPEDVPSLGFEVSPC